MGDLAVAFGLFLVLEGLAYAAFPGVIKRLARELPEMPDNLLRNFGVVAMAIGVAIVWFFKSRG